MKVSYGLPTHRVDLGEELISAGAITELARAAESAGFDAVHTTEHPFPDDAWLAHGGHHALDPLIALSFAAAATSSIRLHTSLFIVTYRNPFLAAKGVATLDVLSQGRVILGIGAGYLQGEFEALGVSFDDRNDRMDEAIVAMQQAWTGNSVTMSGAGFHAAGNTMLPRPAQKPHPPIWIGGNSRRAMRRAVEMGDAWAPHPSPKVAGSGAPAPMSSFEDLARRLDDAHAHAEVVGRTAPLDICFVPEGLTISHPGAVDEEAIVGSCRELAEVGVTWVVVALPGETRQEQLATVERWATAVLPVVHDL